MTDSLSDIGIEVLECIPSSRETDAIVRILTSDFYPFSTKPTGLVTELLARLSSINQSLHQVDIAAYQLVLRELNLSL